jgi:hypothetical protein
VTVLFAAASFLTAALLFLVQPLVGRMVLPAFGGSPQVWTTSMLFFQVALLVGYGYTHLATTRLPRRVQPWLHLVLVAAPLAVLPIALDVVPSGRGGVAPSLELLAGLVVGVGAPFVLVATSGPLVQRWLSWTDHARASDPYFLYAAGNVGSAVGLLAYPLVLEPTMTVTVQARFWAGGYALAVVLLAICAFAVRRRARADLAGDEPPAQAADDGAPVEAAAAPAATASASVDAAQASSVHLPPRRVARWVLLSFVPSSLMLAATAHLSTDVAAVPLLWVLPLGIYLLTFSVAFSRPGPAATRIASWLAPVAVVAALAVDPGVFGVGVAVVVQLVLVAVGGLVAHGQLSADRPHPSALTRFYLWVAVGGALGGIANGLLAPAFLPTVAEHGLVAAGTLALVVRWREVVVGAGRWRPFTRLVVASLLALLPIAAVTATVRWWLPEPWWSRAALFAVLLAPLASRFGRSGAVGVAVALVATLPHVQTVVDAEEVERTFFGVHRVLVDGDHVSLLHGTTLHGTQDLSGLGTRRRPTTYYDPDGPFGPIGEELVPRGDTGVIGLGSGAIAAYGVRDTRMVFHEIDPAVVRLADDHFTYLRDSRAEVETVLGDGRLTVAAVDGGYHTLLVDAFSSDAIPVHLLTLEAVVTYLEAVTDDGVIGFHITNRHLDLRPVTAAIARELALDAVIGRGEPAGYSSTWIVLARDPARLDPLRQRGYRDLDDEVGAGDQVLWTDQRSDLLRVLRR